MFAEKLRTLEDGGSGKLIACLRGNKVKGPTWEGSSNWVATFPGKIYVRDMDCS